MASDNPSTLLQLATAAEEDERASGDIPTPAEDTASVEISPQLLLQQMADLRASLRESQAREAQRGSLMEQLTQIVATQTPNNAPDRPPPDHSAQRVVKNVRPPSGLWFIRHVLCGLPHVLP